MGHWLECWQCCGDGYYGHECGEDCCMCLHPEPNVVCDICDGAGGWDADEEMAPEKVRPARPFTLQNAMGGEVSKAKGGGILKQEGGE